MQETALVWAKAHNAFSDKLDWIGTLGELATIEEAWKQCPRGDWLLWIWEEFLPEISEEDQGRMQKVLENIVEESIEYASKAVAEITIKGPDIWEWQSWAENWINYLPSRKNIKEAIQAGYSTDRAGESIGSWRVGYKRTDQRADFSRCCTASAAAWAAANIASKENQRAMGHVANVPVYIEKSSATDMNEIEEKGLAKIAETIRKEFPELPLNTIKKEVSTASIEIPFGIVTPIVPDGVRETDYYHKLEIYKGFVDIKFGKQVEKSLVREKINEIIKKFSEKWLLAEDRLPDFRKHLFPYKLEWPIEIYQVENYYPYRRPLEYASICKYIENYVKSIFADENISTACNIAAFTIPSIKREEGILVSYEE